MILVASPSKPFQFTPKGTPKRKVVIADYATEIEELYATVEQSSQTGVQPPAKWSLEGIKNFVRATVKNVVETEEEFLDEDDIFQNGADRYALSLLCVSVRRKPVLSMFLGCSLSATWIRNSILLALRKTGPLSSRGIRALPIDFVFTFPSISTLSAFLFGVTLTAEQNQETQSGDKVDDEEDDEVIDTKWTTELGKVGQTIVKLRKSRKGEPPLIVIHGAGGTVHAFGPLQEKFRSALWVIQVTPDVPLTSLEAQTAFYFEKIKVRH